VLSALKAAFSINQGDDRMKTGLIVFAALATLGSALSAQAVRTSSWTASAPAIAAKFQPGKIARRDTEESMMTLSPDASEIFWGVSREWFPMSRVSEIWTARRTGATWKTKRADFSTGYSDGDPFVSHDGKQIFFVSVRPVGPPRKDFDIYVVDRTKTGFSKARNLGGAVNSPEDELYPSMAGDGTLYFASDRSGTWKTYRARRSADGTYPTAEALPETVNAEGSWNFNPYISEDGKTLLFTSQRKGGAGKGDIWLAQMSGSGEFGPARNLGPKINSAEDEFHATLSPDKRALFFVRRSSTADANADLYWVSTKGLGL
jgi:Tol biopolymer transport system component